MMNTAEKVYQDIIAMPVDDLRKKKHGPTGTVTG